MQDPGKVACRLMGIKPMCCNCSYWSVPEVDRPFRAVGDCMHTDGVVFGGSTLKAFGCKRFTPLRGKSLQERYCTDTYWKHTLVALKLRYGKRAEEFTCVQCAHCLPRHGKEYHCAYDIEGAGPDFICHKFSLSGEYT